MARRKQKAWLREIQAEHKAAQSVAAVADEKPTLKTWTHPTTGEIRVYVNSTRLWPGVKLWFVREETAGEAFADFRISGVQDAGARKAAEELANEIGQACGGQWDTLVSMAH